RPSIERSRRASPPALPVHIRRRARRGGNGCPGLAMRSTISGSPTSGADNRGTWPAPHRPRPPFALGAILPASRPKRLPLRLSGNEQPVRADPPSVALFARLPLGTAVGEFDLYGFQDQRGDALLALVRGRVEGRHRVLTRLHSECLTGDALGSLRCDCGV